MEDNDESGDLDEEMKDTGVTETTGRNYSSLALQLKDTLATAVPLTRDGQDMEEVKVRRQSREFWMIRAGRYRRAPRKPHLMLDDRWEVETTSSPARERERDKALFGRLLASAEAKAKAESAGSRPTGMMDLERFEEMVLNSMEIRQQFQLPYALKDEDVEMAEQVRPERERDRRMRFDEDFPQLSYAAQALASVRLGVRMRTVGEFALTRGMPESDSDSDDDVDEDKES